MQKIDAKNAEKHAKSAKGGEKEKVKRFLAGLGILSLVLVVAGPVLAADTGTVTATVTPGTISVTVDPGAVGYGTVGVPSIDSVPTTPSADKVITTENTGGIPETFTIKGTDATSSAPSAPQITWNITDGAPSGVGGMLAYGYNHKFIDCASSETCVSPGDANTMTKDYETLATNVHPTTGDKRYFKLRLSTPTETGGDTSEHSTTVTVLAIAY